MRHFNNSSKNIKWTIDTSSLYYYSEESSIDTDWNGYILVFTPLGWLATVIAIAMAFVVVHIVAKNSNINLVDSLAFAVASFALRELDQGRDSIKSPKTSLHNTNVTENQ